MTPTERSGKFVIERHRKGLRRGFWVRAVGANGETLSHSEMVTSRAAAETNIEAQRQLVDAPIEDRTQDRRTVGGYTSSRPATDLTPPPAGPAPGARRKGRP